MLRIYIQDGNSKFYFVDLTVADDMEHPVFAAERAFAMTFPTACKAMAYRERLIAMGYHPHIE